MLRITPQQLETGTLLLIVEGSLSGPWVQELEIAVDQALWQNSGKIALDMAAVSFVDTCGSSTLRRLRELGIPLQAASPFVVELLRGFR